MPRTKYYYHDSSCEEIELTDRGDLVLKIAFHPNCEKQTGLGTLIFHEVRNTRRVRAAVQYLKTDTNWQHHLPFAGFTTGSRRGFVLWIGYDYEVYVESKRFTEI